MNLHSIKTRFIGGYFFLILLFVIQLPIIYVLVGGMSKKYVQVEEAGALRKRAVEINYILNRHILNGEEELEKVFQTMKGDYGAQIEALKKGSNDVPAITEPAVLAKLAVVEQRWGEMKTALDEAMDAGDALSTIIRETESSTFPMVGKWNEIVKDFVALKDPAYGKSIDMAGLQRMKTVKISYLMERYARSNYDLDVVSADLAGTINEFDDAFRNLRSGSSEKGIKAVANKALLERFTDVEGIWLKRKTMVLEGMKRKDVFYQRLIDLSNKHTPQIVAAADDLTHEIAAGARRSAMKGLAIMAVAIGVSSALAFFFMWLTNQHIIKPVIRMKDTVEGFANGDLSKRADISLSLLGTRLRDEVTSLGDSVDAMGAQMSEVIGRIADSSSHLASASEQLSLSSTQIAEGADKQSNQTAQVATSMEEMNATVIEVAKNSQQVSESARSAQDIAVKGGDVVTQAISAMQEVAESTGVTADTIKKLGKSSEEIGTIVSVINDIADQTNLLALNAAIEAARAGEQGRGFAVVADEVRKLAERTTKATKEISGMINTIQTETYKAVNAMAEGTTKVENGVKLANEAGDALKSIVSGVENVTDMISHIATSAEEQSSTTDEISRNMDSIADVARSNVSAIGEVSKATNEMARLASELRELVANFKMAKGGEVAEISIASAHARKRSGAAREPHLKISGEIA